VTGKNVPEKRNIGVIANRNSGLKISFSAHAESAETGAPIATPIRIATGHARIASGE
jgi:hypothetical protein